MVRLVVRLAACGILFIVFGMAASVEAETPVHPGDIRVEYPWARSSDGSVAVYMTLADVGTQGGRLLQAATPVAASAGLYRASNNGGAEKRHPLDAIAIPPGGTLRFRPGGLYVRLTGLKAPLAKGSSFPLTLYFAGGAQSNIDIPLAN